MSTIKTTVTVPVETIKRIERMAASEQRTLSNMISVLLREAITHRDQK